LDDVQYFLESENAKMKRKHTFVTEESKYAIYMEDCNFYWDLAENVDGVWIIRSKKEEKDYISDQRKKHEKRAIDHINKLDDNKDVATRRLESSTTRYSMFVLAEGKTNIYNLEDGEINEDRVDGPALHSYTDFDLVGINLKVKKGTFYLLIGEEGSGKTSLVSTLFGELKLELIEKPTFYIQGTRFLISNRPWLLTGSLKENIIMN
jgi:ABC transporter